MAFIYPLSLMSSIEFLMLANHQPEILSIIVWILLESDWITRNLLMTYVLFQCSFENVSGPIEPLYPKTRSKAALKECKTNFS